MTIQGKRGIQTSDQLTEAQEAARAAGAEFVPFEAPPEPGRRSRRRVVDVDAPSVAVGTFVTATIAQETWPAIVVKSGEGAYVFVNAFTTKGVHPASLPYLHIDDPRDHWNLVNDTPPDPIEPEPVEPAVEPEPEPEPEPESVEAPKPAKKAAKKTTKKAAKKKAS